MVDDRCNQLNKKFDAEVAKRKETLPTANEVMNKDDEIEQMKIENAQSRNLINQAIQGLQTLTAQVHSSSDFKNKEKIDEIDQYMRRNSLLWDGLRVSLNLYGIDFIIRVIEEINKLFPNLKQPVQLHHIDDAHPLKTSNGSILIIVKFSCRWMKNEIYKVRSSLKGTDVSVFEQLTTNTQNLLDNVRAVVGKDTKVYTNNCVINFKFNNRKYFVKNYKDLQFIASKVTGKVSPPPPPGIQALPDTQHTQFFNPYFNSNAATTPDNNFPPDYSNNPIYMNPSYLQPQGKPTQNGRGRGIAIPR